MLRIWVGGGTKEIAAWWPRKGSGLRTEYLLLYLSNRANTQRLGRGVAEGALLSALLVINLGTHPAPGLRSAGVVRQGGRAVALPDTASCEISPQCRRIFAFPDA